MSDLDRLFYWRGIAAEYLNYRGEHVVVPVENRLNLLQTMGIEVSDNKAVSDAAYELDVEPWRHFFPPLQICVVRPPGNKSGFYINLHPERLTKELQWQLVSASGDVVDKGALTPSNAPESGDYSFEGLRYSRRFIETKITAPGYYRIKVALAKDPKDKHLFLKETENVQHVEGRLALAPATVYQPEWLNEPGKLWGFIVQLYTLRSETDWGIGDFSDLKKLIGKAVEYGADLIGLNPLHALMPDVANHNSPYSPSDRRLINPLYIDPCDVPEYQALLSSQDASWRELIDSEIEPLREAGHVNYEQVKHLKYKVFELLFEQFLSSEAKTDGARNQAFEAFIASFGQPLLQFAVYETLNNTWPGAKFRRAAAVTGSQLNASSLDTMDEQTRGCVRFHCYLQWLAHCQLEDCQAFALARGMKVGLVRDLAVGADGGGSEVTAIPGQFCTGASVGAPPDPLAEQGQNWGLPPMDPAFSRDTGFAHFIQILRENMSRCGALRIDHAMSLMRLWWCPPGTTADHGAYVYYPFEDMLALLCLESYLNDCAIIGEDLGVVPHEFREAITRAGIFTNRVFYFEKEHYSKFKAPDNYDEHALAMVNNHDVPTLKSWWDGTDLVLRDRLNIFEEGVDYETMVEQRLLEKQQVLDFLLHQGCLPPDWHDLDVAKPADEPLISAILSTVSRVASRLYVVQLEDVLLMEAPVNVPGTYKEYPNWQRKLSAPIEHIFDSSFAKTVLTRINQERKR